MEMFLSFGVILSEANAERRIYPQRIETILSFYNTHSTPSLPLPVGRTFLDEGIHPLFLVFAGKQQVERAAFVL